MTGDGADDATDAGDLDGADGADDADDADGKSPLSRLRLPGASLSALAIERGGDVLDSYRPDAVALPASNAKLVTTALALDVLGPAHRFETPAVARGTLDGTTLDGDLVVRASGDPSIEVADLDALAAAVADRLDRIRGDIVLDVSLFSGPKFAPGRAWADGRHAYGAPTGALSLESNCVTVSVAGDGEGEEDVAVAVTPAAADVRTAVDLTIDADAAPDDLSVETDQRDGTVSVTGRVPPDVETTVETPVVSPARYTGAVLDAALSDAGVAVDGAVVVERDGDAREATGKTEDAATERLGSIRSPPVRALVREMNVPSDNVIADQFARAVAARAGEGRSWEGWQTLAEDRFDALGVETVRFADGSGLSRYDRVSARGVVALLSWVSDRPWSAAFFESLPAPGEGTLETRLDGLPVRAKTGTLTGARALSGRIERSGESAVLFSVLVDDLTVRVDEVRALQDEWVRSLVE